MDAPEFVYSNLECEAIDSVRHLLLTHWHPDHTAGLRVVQSRTFARVFAEAEHGMTDATLADQPTIVTTERVFERTCELYSGLRHFVDVGFAETHFLDEKPLVTDGIRIEAIPYSLSADADPDATAFVLREGDRTVVLATDDARFLEESALPDGIDLAVFECGYFEETPDGTSILAGRDEAVLADELTHAEVLERIDRLDPTRTVPTEIEHLYGRGHDDYQRLTSTYDGIEFAHDGLTIVV
ncbi:MBL fold metallo-hydrolase [Natronomonas sp.]|uniref:MBL fold metallo-hydrolase n=1 Tax=Natronomonas sp. TaxID=2184060 RepID=UPI003974AD35